jgi:hypothetical protein
MAAMAAAMAPVTLLAPVDDILLLLILAMPNGSNDAADESSCMAFKRTKEALLRLEGATKAEQVDAAKSKRVTSFIMVAVM